jgi:hypothetical protein
MERVEEALTTIAKALSKCSTGAERKAVEAHIRMAIGLMLEE